MQGQDYLPVLLPASGCEHICVCEMCSRWWKQCRAAAEAEAAVQEKASARAKLLQMPPVGEVDSESEPDEPSDTSPKQPRRQAVRSSIEPSPAPIESEGGKQASSTSRLNFILCCHLQA